MNEMSVMVEKQLTTVTSQPQRSPTVRRALAWWEQIVVLLVVFIAGGAIGAMVAAKVIHSRMEYYRLHAEALPNDILPRLQRKLALTDEQTEQVREIIDSRHPVMIEIRQQGAQSTLNEFQSMEDEVAGVLDAGQQAIWRDIAASVRERFLPRAPGE